MKFQIHSNVFETLPEYVVGVVVAKGIKHTINAEETLQLLRSGETVFRAQHPQENFKAHPDLAPFRKAFELLGINPNRFPSSIEAMGKRVVGGASLPELHPVIDLVNGLSLTYALPMGAHDLDQLGGNFEVRFSKEGEPFIALGTTEEEYLPAGELIYGDLARVRTRRWIWRQSEWGKVTSDSSRILFPIDGFADSNLQKVLAARTQLAEILSTTFGAEVAVYLLNKENNAIDI